MPIIFSTSADSRCSWYLGNAIKYYGQFSDAVEQAIEKLVAPVEKDFNVSEAPS